ncbi:BadF/BadG/BcrA/BcrD ATPase family protein [Micromonospora sp. CPCC 205539]|uniref:N-acetylglucosamine kinase n=1 Tax=Micromonospora sp. CPCC 205539 TaxID=3122408 RepID=UPI002FF339B4
MVLVLGIDAGGTASRAVVATRDGAVLGRGSAGPGNPTAGPAAAHAIGAAVREALGSHDPAVVLSAVAGLAGVANMADPRIAEAFAQEWVRCGLSCRVTVVGDAVAAFAAGTPAPSGAVLIAGTGAVAARIDDWSIGHTVDGLGWLLGDEGSGVWLGLQAIRSVVRAWPTSTVAPRLATAIAAQAQVTTRDGLVHWAGHQQPRAFAALAPLVCECALAGDALAERLIAEAAARLVASLGELGPPGGPVVLAGSLLTRATPVRAAVLAALASPIATAGEPAVGAAWLALRQVIGQKEATGLHDRMLRLEPRSMPRGRA